MNLTKFNTALDLKNLTIEQIRELYELSKETVNRVGHTGLRLNDRDEWNILIFYDEEYKRVYPEYTALVDFHTVKFDVFISIHFKNEA